MAYAEATPGAMMAYAVEKAHTSRRRNGETLQVRRNEAIAEFMLEYCLLLSPEIPKALATALSAACPNTCNSADLTVA